LQIAKKDGKLLKKEIKKMFFYQEIRRRKQKQSENACLCASARIF